MNVLPPDSNWPEYYFNKLIDRGDCNSLTLPNNKAEVIDYLKIWNRTSLNNGSTIDLIDYEQLIYYELTYKDDEDIQLLISILKEKNGKMIVEMKFMWYICIHNQEFDKCREYE